MYRKKVSLDARKEEDFNNIFNDIIINIVQLGSSGDDYSPIKQIAIEHYLSLLCVDGTMLKLVQHHEEKENVERLESYKGWENTCNDYYVSHVDCY